MVTITALPESHNNVANEKEMLLTVPVALLTLGIMYSQWPGWCSHNDDKTCFC